MDSRSPSVITGASNGGAAVASDNSSALVKYMTDYDEYSPFTVVLDHLQFSTLQDYASSARARLESSRLHSPPLLFLFRVMDTAPLYENREVITLSNFLVALLGQFCLRWPYGHLRTSISRILQVNILHISKSMY